MLRLCLQQAVNKPPLAEISRTISMIVNAACDTYVARGRKSTTTKLRDILSLSKSNLTNHFWAMVEISSHSSPANESV